MSSSKAARLRRTEAAALTETLAVWNEPASSRTAHQMGRIVHVAADGRPFVDFAGNLGGPVPARCLAGVQADTGDSVLLSGEFADGRPVILGVISDRLAAPAAPAKVALIDGDRLILEGKEEVVLRCGAASITLRKDGKVLVQGAQIVSKATGIHKIKGAAVAIN